MRAFQETMGMQPCVYAIYLLTLVSSALCAPGVYHGLRNGGGPPSLGFHLSRLSDGSTALPKDNRESEDGAEGELTVLAENHEAPEGRTWRELQSLARGVEYADDEERGDIERTQTEKYWKNEDGRNSHRETSSEAFDSRDVMGRFYPKTDPEDDLQVDGGKAILQHDCPGCSLHRFRRQIQRYPPNNVGTFPLYRFSNGNSRINERASITPTPFAGPELNGGDTIRNDPSRVKVGVDYNTLRNQMRVEAEESIWKSNDGLRRDNLGHNNFGRELFGFSP